MLGRLRTVETVTDDWRAHVSEMNSQLVRATRLREQANKLPIVSCRFNLVIGHSFLTTAGNDGHLISPRGMWTKISVDRTARLELIRLGNDGQVFFANRVALESCIQVFVDWPRASENHHA